MHRKHIKVNGRGYTLQHPGNREWVRLHGEIYTLKKDGGGRADMLALLDYCFEHVVLPDRGPKISVDNYAGEPADLQVVWGPLLISFLGTRKVPANYDDGDGPADSGDSPDADEGTGAGEGEEKSEDSDSARGPRAIKSGRAISGRVPRGKRGRGGNTTAASA